jgi:hypothetical protein
LPVPLAVLGKSSAMRAGLVIEKPIGDLAIGFFMATRTMMLAPC